MANNPQPQKATVKLTAKELSTNNYIALLTVGIIILVVICGFIMNGLAHSFLLNNRVIGKKNAAKGQLQQNLKDADQLISAYEELGDQQHQLIDDALPTTPDFPEMVSIIENMALASDIKLSSVAEATATGTAVASGSSSAPSVGTTPQPLDITMEVAGQYSQITNFVKNMELSARPITVKNVQFQGDSTNLKVQISIETYYQGTADLKPGTEIIK